VNAVSHLKLQAFLRWGRTTVSSP